MSILSCEDPFAKVFVPALHAKRAIVMVFMLSFIRSDEVWDPSNLSRRARISENPTVPAFGDIA
jgi:hypothetical protein